MSEERFATGSQTIKAKRDWTKRKHVRGRAAIVAASSLKAVSLNQGSFVALSNHQPKLVFTH